MDIKEISQLKSVGLLQDEMNWRKYLFEINADLIKFEKRSATNKREPKDPGPQTAEAFMANQN